MELSFLSRDDPNLETGKNVRKYMAIEVISKSNTPFENNRKLSDIFIENIEKSGNPKITRFPIGRKSKLIQIFEKCRNFVLYNPKTGFS